jgi:hypothetical protein
MNEISAFFINADLDTLFAVLLLCCAALAKYIVKR